MFKPWIPDTPATLMKCVDVCFEAMNLGKLVKEESEMTKKMMGYDADDKKIPNYKYDDLGN